MDFFTKNKMLFWCVIMLIILNAITLTSFWMGKPLLRPPIGPGMTQDGQRIMEQRLRLTQQQAQQFEKIRNEHFMRTRPLQDDMHKLRLDLLNEIFAPEPDEAIIEELFSKLGVRQTEFERKLYQHFRELKKVCTPEQTEELKRMLRDLIERTRLRDPQQCPQGPVRDFGPGRNGAGPDYPGRLRPDMPPEHMPPTPLR